jgi:hypothetical protein
MNDRFTYKFLEALPDTIPLSELIKVLGAVNQIIDGLLEDQGPTPRSPVWSLINIVEGSTELLFRTDEPDDVLPLVEYGFKAMGSGNYSGLPRKCASAMSSLSEANRRWGRAEVYVNGLVIPISAAPTVQTQPEHVMGSTVLYGRLQAIGGPVKPAALLSLDSGGPAIRCSVAKELVKALAPRIYDRIGVEGIAEYDASNWSISSFVIERVLDYEDVPISQALEAVYTASPSAWANINDVEGFISRMRYEEDDREC